MAGLDGTTGTAGDGAERGGGRGAGAKEAEPLGADFEHFASAYDVPAGVRHGGELRRAFDLGRTFELARLSRKLITAGRVI